MDQNVWWAGTSRTWEGRWKFASPVKNPACTHRRSQGALGASPPRIQDWQSTKNRRLEGPIPCVLIFNLSRQNKPKFTILRSKTKKKFQWGGETSSPHPTPSAPLAFAPQFDPRKKIDKSSTVPPRQIPGTPMRTPLHSGQHSKC